LTAISDSKQRVELIKQVQGVLDEHRPSKYPLRVAEILEEDDWYHVVVQSEDDQRDNEFYDALANSEAALEKLDSKHHYLLVPVIAD